MTKAEKLIGTITDLAKLQGKIFAKSKSKVTINLVTHTIKQTQQTNSHTQQNREESVHTEGNVYRRLIRHTIQLHTYSEIFVARFERVHIFRGTFLEHLRKKKQTNKLLAIYSSRRCGGGSSSSRKTITKESDTFLEIGFGQNVPERNGRRILYRQQNETTFPAERNEAVEKFPFFLGMRSVSRECQERVGKNTEKNHELIMSRLPALKKISTNSRRNGMNQEVET